MSQAEFSLGVSLPLEKALIEKEDGDLIIEGIAADYSVDRQGEAFVPGCFEKAIGKFLERGGPLMYHHQHDKQLGQVLDLQSRSDGLFIKAVIPKPPESSPLLDIYNKVKRGMMKGVSVFGTAIREMTPDGVRIVDTDLQEISITPMPIGPNTLIGVAQKAFPADFEEDCGCGELSKADADEARSWFDKRYNDLMDRLFDPSDPRHTTDALLEKEAGGLRKAAGGAAQRKAWAKKGIALSDGSFPITHCGSDAFSNGAARRRAHQGSASESTIMAHIRKREKALGCSTGGADSEE